MIRGMPAAAVAGPWRRDAAGRDGAFDTRACEGLVPLGVSRIVSQADQQPFAAQVRPTDRPAAAGPGRTLVSVCARRRRPRLSTDPCIGSETAIPLGPTTVGRHHAMLRQPGAGRTRRRWSSRSIDRRHGGRSGSRTTPVSGPRHADPPSSRQRVPRGGGSIRSSRCQLSPDRASTAVAPAYRLRPCQICGNTGSASGPGSTERRAR